jgi:CRP/FNR family transcriptional regulator, cyclic AMP receptor protein
MMLAETDTIRIFQKQSDPQLMTAGEVIYKEGQPGTTMYGILEGEVDLFVDNQVYETLKAGDVFGIRALIYENALRDSTAIAKTDGQLVYLNRERFYFAVQEIPMFALNVMRNYAERLRYLKKMV